ncbi:MAG TPA: phosphate signaling complex protein PhoU [Actinocrinis sp.]|nr:phosphate signaling complex protein PhoU [Actinocrinis sp.]
MRDVYHEELDAVGQTLVQMAGMVGTALERATAALLDADLQTAETVISGDEAVDALQQDLEVRILDLIARQQPVAGDLRTLVTSLRMSSDLERMGDLAEHVAKVARMRYPQSAIPAELHADVREMGRIGAVLAGKVAQIIEGRDTEAARELESEDDAVDHLHRALFSALLDKEKQNPYTMETAIDVTLVGRYYERFADHAVSVADRLVFLVTGELVAA